VKPSGGAGLDEKCTLQERLFEAWGEFGYADQFTS